MKYSQIIHCNKEALWDRIEVSILYEIEQSTHKSVSLNELRPGYKYQKKIKAIRGGSLQSEVEILELEKYHKYVVKFTNCEGVNIVSYTIENLSEKQCRIFYEERYIAKKKLNSWNAKLVGGILSFQNKNKIKKMFTRMEEYIIEQQVAD